MKKTRKIIRQNIKLPFWWENNVQKMRNNYWIKNRTEIIILSALSLIALYAIGFLLYIIDFLTGCL